MPTTAETLRLVAELRREVAHITDARSRQLVEAWVRAWDQVSVEFESAILDLLNVTPGQWPTRAQIARATRAQAVLTHAQATLERLAEDARIAIITDTSTAASLAMTAQDRLITSQLPPSMMAPASAGVSFDRISRDAIDAIVRRTTEQITSLTRPLSAEATDAMRNALIRGVAVGDNPRATAARLLRTLEGQFNGGLTRALTIARTETLDAHRAGSMAGRKANVDVLAGWRWSCDLSARTCPACLSMNGSLHDVLDPGPQGHPNCRCAAIPVTKSWADLGFTGMPEPADTFPDARAWFDAQDKAVQTQIMGPGRLAALDSGQASWGDLATKQTNTGWRDSWQSTPVRALTA